MRALDLAEMAKRGNQYGPREIRLGYEKNPMPQKRRRCLVSAGKKVGHAEQMEILLSIGGVQPHGSLDEGNCLKGPSLECANLTETPIGFRGIRVELHREIGLGFRPAKIPLEGCNPGRDDSRKRFVGVC